MEDLSLIILKEANLQFTVIMAGEDKCVILWNALMIVMVTVYVIMVLVVVILNTPGNFVNFKAA
jgi:hypothetical protein